MIRAIRKLSSLVKNIYKDRRLMLSLAGKDFKRRFAGSYFGMVWGFLNPLLTILVYWVVFQFAFNNGSKYGYPFVLWFTAGIVPWLFIAEAFSSASISLLEYNYLVKKVVFNIDILPMVKIISSGIIHMFFVLLVFSISLMAGRMPSPYLLQLFYYFGCAVALVFALSLFTSAITVFFRDMNQIISIILLIGMWGTPIAWDAATLGGTAGQIIKLNPFYYIVEGYRNSFIGGVWFWEKYNQTAYFWLLTAALCVLGSVVFNRLKPHFADVL